MAPTTDDGWRDFAKRREVDDKRGEMNRKFNAGFTLLELLVVIVIIGMLMGILLPVFSRTREMARRRKRDSDLKTLPMAVNNFFYEFNKWPILDQSAIDPDRPLVFTNGNDEVANILTTKTNGLVFLQSGDYSIDDDGNIVDPWRRPYVFTFATESNAFHRIGVIVGLDND